MALAATSTLNSLDLGYCGSYGASDSSSDAAASGRDRERRHCRAMFSCSRSTAPLRLRGTKHAQDADAIALAATAARGNLRHGCGATHGDLCFATPGTGAQPARGWRILGSLASRYGHGKRHSVCRIGVPGQTQDEGSSKLGDCDCSKLGDCSMREITLIVACAKSPRLICRDGQSRYE